HFDHPVLWIWAFNLFHAASISSILHSFFSPFGWWGVPILIHFQKCGGHVGGEARPRYISFGCGKDLPNCSGYSPHQGEKVPTPLAEFPGHAGGGVRPRHTFFGLGKGPPDC